MVSALQQVNFEDFLDLIRTHTSVQNPEWARVEIKTVSSQTTQMKPAGFFIELCIMCLSKDW